MVTKSQTSILSLRYVLEKDKLSGTNFLDWYGNLRIILKQEQKLYILEQVIPPVPAVDATATVKKAHKKILDDSTDVTCLTLCTMNSELQKQHENMEAYDMIIHLKQLFQEQAKHERFEVSKALFKCNLPEGNSVGPHVLRMIGYLENLEGLGFPFGQELATDLIVQSLLESYSQLLSINDVQRTVAASQSSQVSTLKLSTDHNF